MLFQILWMLVTIAALLAVSAAAFYILCYLTLLTVRLFPLIGKRHRHQRWAEFNSGAERSDRLRGFRLEAEVQRRRSLPAKAGSHTVVVFTGS